MDELTLIGFSDHDSRDGFCEFYATRDRQVYRFKRGEWVDPVDGDIISRSSLDAARYAHLLQKFDQWCLNQPVDTERIHAGLKSRVPVELSVLISQYSAALEPYPLPTPSDVFFGPDEFKFIGEFAARFPDEDEPCHREFWLRTCGACQLYVARSNHHDWHDGVHQWYWDYGEEGFQKCSLFWSIVFTDWRSQILRVPLR